MRVALCQINTTVGDLDGNRARVLSAAIEAARQGAGLAIFPELTLTGYPPRDLLDRRAFIDDNLRAVQRLRSELPPQITCLVGFVERREAPQPRLRNAVALIRGGAIERVMCKRLLPTYDVFDEDRYFEAGERAEVFELGGVEVGVTICEDAWNAVDSPLRSLYAIDPVREVVEAGAQILVNVSASPFSLLKHKQRPEMLAAIARTYQRPLLFTNLVGGNDDLIFDGSSAIYGSDGATWAAAPGFEEQVLVCDVAPAQTIATSAATDADAALAALVLGTRDYARKCGFTRAVLGVSGGIDSALVAAIAARALGPSNVLGVAMPTRYSSQSSLADARALVEQLGISFRVISIDEIFQRYLDTWTPELEALGPAPPSDTTFENIQARIRGNTLMAISNRLGHLLLTTGNKSELAVGYCTLYGDMAGGLGVISDLPKTFVYDVARAYNRAAGVSVIPESTFSKAPSAELRPNQRDEDSLPPYTLLDALLSRLIEQGQSTEQVVAAGYDREVVERVASLVWKNEYKRRQMPPGLIVTRKAFGPGRRYPIAQRYRG